MKLNAGFSAILATTIVLAGCASDQQRTESSGPQTTGSSSAELVQPETLEQGFIIVVEDVNKVANASDPITIGTNHGDWNPGHSDWVMTPRSDGRWQILVDKPDSPGRMQFKFARGDWETVELDHNGAQIENRILDPIDASVLGDGERPILEFVVRNWADQMPGATRAAGVEDPETPLEVEGNAYRLQVVSGAGAATNRVRDAIVWVPPGYHLPENQSRRYPVLYLMDGQNVFAEQPGVPGEWHADETATRMIRDGEISPMIIVGVPHSGPERANEYLPDSVLEGVDADADRFVGWLAHEVVPRVDRAFRTRPDAEGRTIGGASFGGVVSLHAAMSRPGVWSRAIVESPAVLAGDGALLQRFESSDRWPSRVFIGMGGQETGTSPADAERNGAYVSAAERLFAAAANAGLSDDDRMMLIDAEAVHNEQAWASRLPHALRFMFPVAN